jgi:hypothetical protein
VSCTNKGKLRRDLDLLQKQRGVATEQAPSGLKLHIPEPIRIIEEPPPVPSKHSV